MASKNEMRNYAWYGLAVVALAYLASGCVAGEGSGPETCRVAAVPAPLTSSVVDFVDVLFVVDNSGSMRQEQAALRAQFPRLIRMLTQGIGVDGSTFTPVRNLHLGVVSTDMGLPGLPNNFPGCNTQRHVLGGDDGRLLHAGGGGPECLATYPSFLSFEQGEQDPEQLARDFDCIANLGTAGCGFEQPLEAALKALWPKVYTDAQGNTFPPSANPIQFLAVDESGRYGRGDLPLEQGGNLGFLRNNPGDGGVSLLAIIIVTDEEDCSSRTTSHFASTNDPADPLSKQGPNLRCFFNPQNLYDIERYVRGYKGLRPGNEHLVTFGAIVGVPPDLVDARAREDVDWDSEDSPSRDAYYDRLLADPRMQQTPVMLEVPALSNLAPSCMRQDVAGEPAAAYPPIRMIEVAKAFGPNAVVQSICQDDFTPAIDAILEPVVYQLEHTTPAVQAPVQHSGCSE